MRVQIITIDVSNLALHGPHPLKRCCVDGALLAVVTFNHVMTPKPVGLWRLRNTGLYRQICSHPPLYRPVSSKCYHYWLFFVLRSDY